MARGLGLGRFLFFLTFWRGEKGKSSKNETGEPEELAAGKLLAKRKEIKKPRRPRNANPVARESSEWSPKTKGTPKTFQAGETEGKKKKKKKKREALVPFRAFEKCGF
jgi:hypothetical protein